MRSLVKIFSPMLSALCLMAASVSAAADQAMDWELARQEQGIRVFTRPVAGSDIREFRGETEIDAGLNTLMAVLDDTRAFRHWMYNCKAASLVYKPSLLERYQYLLNDFPWPAADRDMLLRNLISQDPDTRIVTVALQAVPLNAVPESHRATVPRTDDVRRVERLQGFFELTPLSDSRSKVVFQLHLDPAGQLPASLVNALIVENPFETLKAMRTRATLAEYRHFDPF